MFMKLTIKVVAFFLGHPVYAQPSKLVYFMLLEVLFLEASAILAREAAIFAKKSGT